MAVLKVMWWRVFLGSLAGMVLTGGALVVIPVIASICVAGAGEGAIIALFTAANLTPIQGLLIMEIPFFGARIALRQYVICLFIPPLTGLLGNLLFKLF